MALNKAAGLPWWEDGVVNAARLERCEPSRSWLCSRRFESRRRCFTSLGSSFLDGESFFRSRPASLFGATRCSGCGFGAFGSAAVPVGKPVHLALLEQQFRHHCALSDG